MKILARYVFFALVLALVSQFANAAPITMIRSWRYTYEVPQGYSYEISRTRDYGGHGSLLWVKLRNAANATWYQMVWIDGDGSEFWKGEARASINSDNWRAIPNGLWYRRLVAPEDDDYAGVDYEVRDEIVLRNEDGTFTEARFSAPQDTAAAAVIGQAGVDELKADGYPISPLGSVNTHFPLVPTYAPSDYFLADFFASRSILNVVSDLIVEFGMDYLALGEISPIQEEPTAPILVPDVVVGLSGANLIIRWKSDPKVSYQVQGASNLTDWEDEGPPFSGMGEILQWVTPITETTTFFGWWFPIEKRVKMASALWQPLRLEMIDDPTLEGIW